MHFKPSLDEPGQLWESWKREVPEIFGNVRFLFILQSFQIKCAPVTGSLIGVGFKAQLVVFTTEYSRKKEFEKKKTRGGSDKIFFILPSIFLKVILKAFCLKKNKNHMLYLPALCSGFAWSSPYTSLLRSPGGAPGPSFLPSSPRASSLLWGHPGHCSAVHLHTEPRLSPIPSLSSLGHWL